MKKMLIIIQFCYKSLCIISTSMQLVELSWSCIRKVPDSKLGRVSFSSD
jgi:hypothetical protein